MKNDLITGAWQHNIGCPISITLLSTSDAVLDVSVKLVVILPFWFRSLSSSLSEFELNLPDQSVDKSLAELSSMKLCFFFFMLDTLFTPGLFCPRPAALPSCLSLPLVGNFLLVLINDFPILYLIVQLNLYDVFANYGADYCFILTSNSISVTFSSNFYNYLK